MKSKLAKEVTYFQRAALACGDFPGAIPRAHGTLRGRPGQAGGQVRARWPGHRSRQKGCRGPYRHCDCDKSPASPHRLRNDCVNVIERRCPNKKHRGDQE